MSHATKRTTAQGFTLLEILVAIVLTALVVVAASNLEITRARFARNTDALIDVQRQATDTWHHMTRRVFNAYFLWFTAATPNVVWIQEANPASVGNPPDPALLWEGNPANAANFFYYAYAQEANQIVFYEMCARGIRHSAPFPAA